MKSIIYTTTNIDKFNKAVVNLEQYGVVPLHKVVELTEPQSLDGEEVVRYKAEQAYVLMGVPVLVNDDSWSIPALRGFPATNMKTCNHFLQSADWLRLMHGVSDRSIFLNSHYALYDGKKMQTFMSQDEMFFLPAARGKHVKAPCLEVVAWSGAQTSIAEEIAVGVQPEKNNEAFWEKLSAAILSLE